MLKRLWSIVRGGDHDVLVAVSLLHDVGIKRSEEMLGYNNGKTQEEYGPPAAGGRLPEGHGVPLRQARQGVRDHRQSSFSFAGVPYVELRILKEADSIVNRMEGD